MIEPTSSIPEDPSVVALLLTFARDVREILLRAFQEASGLAGPEDAARCRGLVAAVLTPLQFRLIGPLENAELPTGEHPNRHAEVDRSGPFVATHLLTPIQPTTELMAVTDGQGRCHAFTREQWAGFQERTFVRGPYYAVEGDTWMSNGVPLPIGLVRALGSASMPNTANMPDSPGPEGSGVDLPDSLA